jgi:protein-disulfide isomerase
MEVRMKLLLLVSLLCAVPFVAAAQTSPAAPDALARLPGETIVAVVDGEAIQLSQVEEYSRTKDPKKLFQLNQQLFEMRESMLGLMLGERLLKLEAEKANLTVDELLEQRLKFEPVTDAEVQEVIDRQPAGVIDLAVVTPLIRQYLEERRREQARARYVAELIAKAKKGPKPLVIYLKPPRQAIPIASSDPVKGTGTIELVEFSDFQCPFCQRVQPVLREVLAKFDGKVKHVWKDYPLPVHQFAATAAAAARCAQEQGQFWEYHDLLFANQQALTSEDLKEHASTLRLDPRAFKTCLETGKYRHQISAALKTASEYVVPATPTVFINGRMVMGVAPVELYTRIINEELAN